MKYLATFVWLLILTINIIPQEEHMGRMQPQKRLKQLEKVKLLEILDMDDETASKVLKLKDLHENNMSALREKQNGILDEIEETLADDGSKKVSSLNKLVGDFEKTEQDMFNERGRFHKEIQNLLPAEKFARFIVFERNFRAEIRDLIMGDRMRRRNPRN